MEYRTASHSSRRPETTTRAPSLAKATALGDRLGSRIHCCSSCYTAGHSPILHIDRAVQIENAIRSFDRYCPVHLINRSHGDNKVKKPTAYKISAGKPESQSCTRGLSAPERPVTRLSSR